MPNSKQIVYLSQAQYTELIANGSITVNGVTVTYDENDIYVTPQAEPVTDVRVAGTTVAANGVADIPMASTSTTGVVKLGSGTATGLRVESGLLKTDCAGTTHAKSGTNNYMPIVPAYQHASVFYGLATASGDTTQSQSSNTVGTYTPEAKGAIQQMLGVSDLIATAENSLVASKAYAVGDVFTANGKLYKVTSAIAADEAIVLQNDGETVSGANAVETKVGEGFVKFTDYATDGVPGVVKVWNTYGVGMIGAGNLRVWGASDAEAKAGAHNYRPITPNHQHQATFYGLAKAAGADEKDSTLPVGQYTDTAKAAIKSMIGVNVEDVQVNGTSMVTNGIANIPVIQAHGQIGAVRTNLRGLTYHNDPYDNTLPKVLGIDGINTNDCKVGSSYWKVAVPAYEGPFTFYGLATAAGARENNSTLSYGTYTDNAKASIKAMLGIQDGSTGTVDVSGTTPTIAAVENTRYVCGEVTSLSFTPPASGISIVRFTSGSTVTVLTLPSTVKFPEWFDPTSLETNTIYEICVTDSVYGAVMSWAL